MYYVVKDVVTAMLLQEHSDSWKCVNAKEKMETGKSFILILRKHWHLLLCPEAMLKSTFPIKLFVWPSVFLAFVCSCWKWRWQFFSGVKSHKKIGWFVFQNGNTTSPSGCWEKCACCTVKHARKNKFVSNAGIRGINAQDLLSWHFLFISPFLTTRRSCE